MQQTPEVGFRVGWYILLNSKIIYTVHNYETIELIVLIRTGLYLVCELSSIYMEM